MPLEILVSLVIVGIAGIALVLHLAGRSKQRVLNKEDAWAQWHRHFPDDIILDAVVSHDRHAALIHAEQGPGLLWAFGADTVGRRLLDFDLLEVPGGLKIMFHDYSAPNVTLHLDEAEQRKWQKLMTER